MPIKVLHVSLEYTYGVGGLKTVLTGLLPALQLNHVAVAIITPYYDFINELNLVTLPLCEVSHMYKGRLHYSNLFQVVTSPEHLSSVNHYLLAPKLHSNVTAIFDINKPENIYGAFKYSEPQDRIEYFNGAVSSIVKIYSAKIPNFDIIQTHAWHTSLSICLIKEFEKLNWVQANHNLRLNVTPKIINTIHMLSNEQGALTGKREIIATIRSLGLNLDIKFLYKYKQLNQMYLGLQYADQTLLVSRGLLRSIINGENYDLGEIFDLLKKIERITTINNGIDCAKFDANLSKNLGILAIPSKDISAAKIKIKQFLLNYYTNLNHSPLSLWYIYIGRFALEKGIDMLGAAFKVIKENSDNLIIMGFNVGLKNENSKITNIIDYFKDKTNVVVIDNNQIQSKFGKYFRAASDFTLVPSHYEACGLVPMEAMMNYSIPITSDVQGLTDTIISFKENPTNGNGFSYNNNIIQRIANLKKTIEIARKQYLQWQQENVLEETLSKVYAQAKYYDWNANPVKEYLNLYKKTISTENIKVPYIRSPFPKIKILHVALEYNEATWGGIGSVTTELVEAQNNFNNFNSFESSIVTPYYNIFPLNSSYISTIRHVYDHNEVESEIYLRQLKNTKHYLIKPKNHDLFELNHPEKIYDNFKFIERIKYFNSAVAGFITNYKSLKLNIIQLHDWTVALIAVLLRENYKFNQSKMVYTVHINNQDCGIYANSDLAGINLNLTKKFYILKQLGIEYSNYTIGVSTNILTECAQTLNLEDTNSPLDSLTKSFRSCQYTKNSSGILNGINYMQHAKIKRFYYNEPNLSIRKFKLKQQLAVMLQDKLGIWKINPELPLILYIGRFSKEKGVGCFPKVIEQIKDQAIFCALGKGANAEIIELIMTNTRKKNNIFLSFSEEEQQKYGEMMRAAAEFMFVPSLIEACGLVAMEGLANGCICITSGVGGLKEFILPFKCNHGKFNGNGFLYQPESETDLLKTIQSALNLWKNLSSQEKHLIHFQITQEAQKFDWLAKGGAIDQYFKLFKEILSFQPEEPRFTKLKHRI